MLAMAELQKGDGKRNNYIVRSKRWCWALVALRAGRLLDLGMARADGRWCGAGITFVAAPCTLR
eukprot:NODE_13310_length_260_cov_16.905213_g12397_i0.p1 GENE.NODE_13310_length_260_cov_16.905213_g12397_i0~~NODE_13310_length_260_cov_16.905213_g12397_i0.p1  ORF type:complete len:64 (-),score=1.17 NODE_13310_length_260_cov_16.905213_g12397_i0:5-196(-)